MSASVLIKEKPAEALLLSGKDKKRERTREDDERTPLREK